MPKDKIHFMGALNKGMRGGLLYVFHCPGCQYAHAFEVGGFSGWAWNG